MTRRSTANGKKVIFRADAAPAIGGGHIMRCLTLAEKLREEGWSCAFNTIPQSPKTVPALAESAFSLFEGGTQPCDLLVVDHYGLDKEYESAARGFAKKIMVIDDLADRPHDCDILVDPTYGRDPRDYAPLVPPSCKVLCGAEYALLRQEFGNLRCRSISCRQINTESIKKIFVFISTTDPVDFTSRVVREIASLSDAYDVVVVGGSVVEDARAQADISSHRFVFLNSAANMADLMAESDLAVGAGGSACWERCCLGLPAIVAVIADNQRLIAEKLDLAGAIVNLGWHEDIVTGSIAKAIQNLGSQHEMLKTMSMRASMICDGEGAVRISAAIASI